MTVVADVAKDVFAQLLVVRDNVSLRSGKSQLEYGGKLLGPGG